MAEVGTAAAWHAPAPDPVRARRLASRLGLHPLVGQLLINRGMGDVATAREFLAPGHGASAPWRLPGVKAAAWRMLQGVRRREPIVVYGDYDADGQTATAILVRALRRLGAQVRPFIPHRLSQGYGLHEDVLVEMAARGVRLVVAVDCGLTALSAIRQAARHGLDVVVVDHHEPGPRLPPAAAVVAAHRMSGVPGGEEMAAAGLAYHTAMALLAFADRGGDPEEDELVQLAAVGTVADVVSLTGENRRLVREGLQRLRARPLPGLQALASVAGISTAEVDAYHIAFILAPRLNAAGRVDDPSVGLALLLARSPEEAAEPAQRLDAANRARQEMERRILEQAVAEAERQVQAGDPPVVVVAGEGWHPGVVGVVASRLVERFARPAVVIALEGEEARGSARSVPDVNLYEAMAACGPLFVKFGGHPMAAGFSMASQDVPALRERLVEAVGARWRGPYASRVDLDAWVSLADVGPELADQLAMLEPHGEGNPRPLLGAAALLPLEARPVGQDGRHLRLVVREPETGVEAGVIAFGRAQEWLPVVERAREAGRGLDVAFVPRRGRWGELEMRALAIRESDGAVPRIVWAWAAPVEVGGGRAPAACGPADVSAVAKAVVGARAAGERRGPVAPPVVEDRRGLADEVPHGAWGEWSPQGTPVASLTGAAGATPVVVAVGDGQAALRLCTAGWRHAPHLAGRVAWAGRPEEIPAPAGLLGDGAAVLITWTPAVLASLPGPVELWVWELPDSPWAWARLVSSGAVRRLVLAYGERQRQRAEERWLAPLPDLETLRHLYRLLTAQASVAGPDLPEDPGQLASSLGVLDPRSRPRLSAALVANAIAVFEELGVVERAAGGRGWRWKGVRAGVKLDLTRSARYNEFIEARRLWQQALEGAFSEAATIWWQDGAATAPGRSA